MQAMNVSGQVKSPPRSRNPMMMGAVMPASPPTPLNMPLVRPISRSGAVAETSDQWIDASPLAKNASERNRMISAGRSTKFAPMMLVDSASPPMIGVLRAKPRLKPRRYSQSDNIPEQSTPAKAPRKGNEA